MNQKIFIAVFAGMLALAAGIFYANSIRQDVVEMNAASGKTGIKSSAPIEVIIWESMGQAVLGSGSIR